MSGWSWDRLLHVVTVVAKTVGAFGLLFAWLRRLIPWAVRTVTAHCTAPRPIGREDLTALVRRILEGTRHETVLFGDDMSWALDYAKVIHNLTQSGRRVVVVCPSDYAKDPVVRKNADVLRKLGSTMITTPFDTKVRGILVDPNESDAVYYYIKPQRQDESVPVEPGWRGRPGDHFHTRLYKGPADEGMLMLVTSLYRLAAANHQQPGASYAYAQGNPIPRVGRSTGVREDDGCDPASL